jgi:predicted nucleic acid-binding protein
MERRHHVSFWDALIIHAARLSGAAVLYTEDLPDGQVYDSVLMLNSLTAGG